MRCTYCKKKLGTFQLTCQNCGTKIPRRINVAIGVTIWSVILTWFGFLFWLVTH